MVGEADFIIYKFEKPTLSMTPPLHHIAQNEPKSKLLL